MARTRKVQEKKGIVFPRHLYKEGNSIQWDSDHSYDRIYVKNDAEYKKAIAKGYMDNFSDAVFGEIEVEEEVINGDFSVDEPVKEPAIDDDF